MNKNFALNISFCYCLVWILTLGIPALIDIDYKPIDFKTYIEAFIITVALIFGDLFSLKNNSDVSIEHREASRYLKLVLVVISCIFIAEFKVLYDIIDGDFSKLEEFKKIRVLNGSESFEQTGFLRMVFSLNVIFVGFLYFVMIGISFFSRKYFFIYSTWILALCFINDLTFVSRTLTYNMAILFLFMVLTRKFKINFYKSLAIVFVFLIGMHFISENSRNEKREIKGIQLPTVLVQLIDYNCGPIVSYNLTQNRSSDDLYYGQFTFMGFLQLYNIFSIYDFTIDNYYFQWADNAEYITRSEDHRRTLNTYTWIRYLKSDFGYLGLVIIPFLTSIIWNFTKRGHSILNGNSYIFYFLVLLIFRSNQQMITDSSEIVALFIFVPFRGFFFDYILKGEIS